MVATVPLPRLSRQGGCPIIKCDDDGEKGALYGEDLRQSDDGGPRDDSAVVGDVDQHLAPDGKGDHKEGLWAGCSRGA